MYVHIVESLDFRPIYSVQRDQTNQYPLRPLRIQQMLNAISSFNHLHTLLTYLCSPSVHSTQRWLNISRLVEPHAARHIRIGYVGSAAEATS